MVSKIKHVRPHRNTIKDKQILKPTCSADLISYLVNPHTHLLTLDAIVGKRKNHLLLSADDN